jgi:hypothetical protein
LSGRYWQLTGPDGATARSRSLWDSGLPAPREDGEAGAVAVSDILGPRGERLRLVQREVVPLRASAPVHVQVAVARGPVDAELAHLRRNLVLAFALFGLGLVGLVVGQVVLGLAPLRRLRQALAEVRAGRRDRLGEGPSPAEVAPFEVAEEIARALARLFAEDGVAIEVGGDAAARVRMDRQDLAEMLGNLLENACKWATRRVTVTVGAEAGEVVIEVGDDGPGVPEASRAAALGRGVRLDEAAPGTGLGLAIVADLAGLHGGALTLGRSREGGLLARLALPGRGSPARG